MVHLFLMKGKRTLKFLAKYVEIKKYTYIYKKRWTMLALRLTTYIN